MNKEIFFSHFALGLYLGLIFAALALYRVFRLQYELRRYKRHLSDKLEIDAEGVTKLRSGHENLRRENENLRVRKPPDHDVLGDRALRLAKQP